MKVGPIVAINYSSLALLTNTSFWLILLFWFTDKSGENSCHGDFGWFWLVFNGVAWVWLVLVLEWHGSKCNTVILKNAQIWKSKNPRKKNKHCKVRYWQLSSIETLLIVLSKKYTDCPLTSVSYIHPSKTWNIRNSRSLPNWVSMSQKYPLSIDEWWYAAEFQNVK